MRLGILCSPDSWYFRDLQRAADKHCQVVALAFDRVAAAIGPEPLGFSAGGCDLRSFDAVLVRTMPPGTLEQVVFRMDVLGQLEAAGGVVINPPRAVEAAVDKYLTLAKLNRAGLPLPRTITCQTVDEAMAGFERLGGDVVLKPLFGSEGRGITRVSDEALALRAFQLLSRLGAAIYLQEFVPHDGNDTRVLVIGDAAYAVRRIHPADWRTNVARGATCEPARLSDHERSLAMEAARTLGAPLAGVDLLRSPEGRDYVIEVNAVPGWKSLAATLEEDIASRVLDFMQQVVRNRQGK